ncbi:hypothetical protein [Streptomyces pinistramenti]|uniref:hypothetical protein n=1 Tax=Streptomyces pinistramenti TaxID=2884812 RepID=UPI001D08E42C|nr:hypothetical protein [Streptomyces pinistramenti]MCB5907174.1 hypothetical protein [Streptomyces pinistramenti]
MRAQPTAAARCGRPLLSAGLAAMHASGHPAPGRAPRSAATARTAARQPDHRAAGSRPGPRAPGAPAVLAARLPDGRQAISLPLRAPLLPRLSVLRG